jgi:hypothetical protein
LRNPSVYLATPSRDHRSRLRLRDAIRLVRTD